MGHCFLASLLLRFLSGYEGSIASFGLGGRCCPWIGPWLGGDGVQHLAAVDGKAMKLQREIDEVGGLK